MGVYYVKKYLGTILSVAIISIIAMGGPVPEIRQAHAQNSSAFDVEELILAVIYPPYVLSNGIFAFQQNSANYVPLIEISELFGFYVDADLGRGYVEGLALAEEGEFFIDIEAGEYGLNGVVNNIPSNGYIDDPYGDNIDIYVSIEVLNELLPVDFELDLSTLALIGTSEVKLEFERRLERNARRDILEATRNRKEVIKDLPYVDNPYQLLGKPTFDVDAQFNRANDGDEVTGSTTISGVQDILGLSADYTANLIYEDGRYQDPENVRLRFKKQAYGEGESLFLDVKSFQGGDIRIEQRDQVSNGSSGRGVEFSNNTRRTNNEFDVITVEGTGIPGYEIELWRNEQLIDFGVVQDDGEYRFEDVPINIGNNQIRVVLFGPQGQVREEIQNFQISGGMVEPGKTEYTVGLVDLDRDFITVGDADRERRGPRGISSSAFVSHGVSEKITVFGSATRLPTVDPDRIGDANREYVSLGAMGTVLGGLAQAEYYQELGGGHVTDLRFATQLKGVTLNLQGAFFKGFESPEAGFGDNARTFEGEFRANTTIDTPIGGLGLRLTTLHRETKEGLPDTDVDFQQSLSLSGIRLTHETSTGFQDYNHISTNGRLSATVRIKKWQFRSQFDYLVHPESDLSNFGGELRYRDPDGFTAAVSAQHSFLTDATSSALQLGYDFDKVLGSVEFDWQKDDGVDIMLRASTSFGPVGTDGRYTFDSSRLSGVAPVQGRVFIDRDSDGVFSEGDEPIPDAQLQVDRRRSQDLTDEDGIVVSRGTYEGLSNVFVDAGTLIDPYYQPAIDGYSTVLRPGTMPRFDFPVIETGAIDGTVVGDDGRAIGGLDIELVNAEGEVIMTTSTAFDGFYTFEFVKPGTYTVRVDPSIKVNVPPETVTVASDDLFAFGIDLLLMEQANEAEAEPVDPVQIESIEPAAGSSGIVAQTIRESTHGTRRPAPLPSEGSFSAFVQRVRIGEHPGKVRFVMDLSGPLAYSVTEEGNRILIDLPDTAWSAINNWRAQNTPVLKSFKTEALENGGTRLVLEGAGLMQVGLNGVIKPDNGKGHRLFIDIEPQL